MSPAASFSFRHFARLQCTRNLALGLQHRHPWFKVTVNLERNESFNIRVLRDALIEVAGVVCRFLSPRAWVHAVVFIRMLHLWQVNGSTALETLWNVPLHASLNTKNDARQAANFQVFSMARSRYNPTARVYRPQSTVPISRRKAYKLGANKLLSYDSPFLFFVKKTIETQCHLILYYRFCLKSLQRVPSYYHIS